MTTYSAQKVTCAAAAAAALATVAGTTYYVYRRRRRGTQNESQPTPTILQSERKPLNNPVQPSSPKSLRPVDPDIHVHNDHHPKQDQESVQSSPDNSTEQPTPAIANSFAWAVFWDIENVPVPRAISTAQFVQALRKTLAAHRKQTHPDSILRIHAIANVRRTSMQLRNHLQANGVNVTHVESKGRKDAADKALITEICLITREHPTPFGICLISGDGDFSYPVSRLTALGYATVVIAPTRHSFSTLLEAVPEAVIPLHSVLESHQPRHIEAQPTCRDDLSIRRPSPQIMRHPLPTVPLPASLDLSRGPDKRVTRNKRRARILPLATVSEEDDDEYRPWSSDDDRSLTRRTNLRMSRRPPQPHSLSTSAEHVAQISASQVNRLHVGDSPVSPPRLIPLPNEHVGNQGGVRPKENRPRRNGCRQDGPQPSAQAQSGWIKGSMSRKISTGKTDIATAQIPISKLYGSKIVANASRVRFAKDTIIPHVGERIPVQENVPQENSSRVVKESSSRRNRREPEHQTSSRANRTSFANTSDALKLPIRIESRWFYCGTRALPFMIMLIVLGPSLLFASLRVCLAVVDVLRRG